MLLVSLVSAGFDDRDTDLFLCDTNTCKFDGECLRIGNMVTCICDFKVRTRATSRLRVLSVYTVSGHLRFIKVKYQCTVSLQFNFSDSPRVSSSHSVSGLDYTSCSILPLSKLNMKQKTYCGDIDKTCLLFTLCSESTL